LDFQIYLKKIAALAFHMGDVHKRKVNVKSRNTPMWFFADMIAFTTMRLLNPILNFCIACMLVGGLQAQSSDVLEQFKTAGSQLKAYAKEYKQVSDADPGNKGANVLKMQLEDVVTSIEGYLAGTLERDEMARTAASALVEARKYNTPKAKEVVKVLTQVQSYINDLAPKLPQNNTVDAPEDGAAVDPEGGAALQPDPKVMANIEVKDAGTGPLERYMVYLLFGLYLLAIVLLWVFLAGVYKRRVRELTRTVEDLQDRMDQLGERRENASSYSDIVQKDLMKRWEMLENNTIEFIARVEEQLKDLQRSRALSNKHLEDRMAQVEATLAAGATQPAAPMEATPTAEAPLIAESPQATEPTVAAPTVAAPAHQAACSALSQLLRELPIIPGIEDMDTLATDLAAAAQRPQLNLNLKPLAELIQLVWLRVQFDKLPITLYQQLKQHAEALNLKLEDQMAGRMSFSEFYADNTPTSKLSDDQVALYLPHQISNEEIAVRAQASTASADAVKNTVLLTLLPTVVLQQEGAKTVLARGHYVVYG
jgi:hypothetical protein